MVKNLCTMFMNNLHIKKIYFLSFLWLHECSAVQSATPSLTCEQNATVTRSPVPGKSDYNRLKERESVPKINTPCLLNTTLQHSVIILGYPE